MPTADDTAHAAIECAGNGECDTQTGICICREGFEGMNCERLVCPNECSGHGSCISMRTAGSYFDGGSFNSSSEYTLWDADVIQGCVCDYGYSGYDCSQIPCLNSDDYRTTGQAQERSTLKCRCDDTCTGEFT